MGGSREGRRYLYRIEGTMREQTWREKSACVIRDIIKDNEGKTPEEIRRILRNHYPFGSRQYYPYKVWLDEIKRQLNIYKKNPLPVPEGQLELFGDSTHAKEDIEHERRTDRGPDRQRS